MAARWSWGRRGSNGTGGSRRSRSRRSSPNCRPATRTGRPWSKLGHYKAITETLEQSGISKEYVPGGAFRLRHTFAIRQLRRNESPQRVAKWLGVQDPDVIARYLAVVDRSEVPV